MRKDWEKHLGDDAYPPTLEQLETFLQSQILTLEAIVGGCKSLMVSVKTTTPNSKSKISDNDVPAYSSLTLQTTPQDSNKAPANRNSKCSLCN